MGFFDFFRSKKQSPTSIRRRLELSTITESEEWKICQSFGLIAGQYISDAALLPRPKERVVEALEIVEQRLCNKGNELIKEQTSVEGIESLSDLSNFYAKERRLVDQYLNAIQGLKVIIEGFVEIDPPDRSRVTHFNSFRSSHDIPASEKNEFFELTLKYGQRAHGPTPPMDKATYDAIVKEISSEEGQEKLRQIKAKANLR